MVPDEHRLVRQIADEGVVADDQLLRGVLRGFLANRYGSAVVFRHIALLQPVALNQHVAAIWDVDQVARIAIRAVGDVVVYQHVDTCTRFDVVTDMLVDETGMHDLEPIDCTDVDAVRARTVALAVAAEVAVHDANGAAARGIGEDTGFVVDEFAAFDCQIATFGADPRPVLVRHRGVLEGDIADGYVVGVDHEDAFPGTALVANDGALAGSVDGQTAGAEHGTVGVVAWCDVDGVAAARLGGSFTSTAFPWNDSYHAAGFIL